MASNTPNKVLAARSSTVLTTSEVAATRLDLNEAWGSMVDVQVDFTIGSLTNVILKGYVSMDGTNYYLHHGPTGAAITQTLTASATIAIPIIGVGWKWFRMSAQGTGTVTSSLLALNYRYLRRASQG